MTAQALRRDGVCVGLTHGNTMLVVRTRRYPDVWQPIGGGVAAGEKPADAAVREVAEETGWFIEPAVLELVVELPMDAHDGTLVFYTAAAPDSAPDIDPGELAESRWATADELLQLPAFAAARQFYSLWGAR
jgi:8-oxo-dGTP pyrophosphatase MutT (NUDIX family)